MKLRIETPTKAFILEATPSEMEFLRSELTFNHTGNQFLYKRHIDNFYFRSKNPVKWAYILEELKKKLKMTLIYQEDDRTFIRPGSIPYIKTIKLEVENTLTYPTPKPMKWANPLPFDLYPYQETGWDLLLKELHGNVSFCTGSGKSATILKLCQQLGLRVAVITPGKGIFLETLKAFEYHFGKTKVGTFGNGSKKIGKQFTICISDSVTNIKPGTEEWEFFNNLDALIVDESHTFGSETLEEICHGVLSNIPYRFFFSATQTRGDGTLKLLQSVIGKTVHTLSTKEAVEKGYICNHDFTIIDLESSNPNMAPKEALDVKRVHVLKNKNIAAFIAKYCNTVCPATNQQVLVLVEELDQITLLASYLTVPFIYAHAEVKAARLEELGLEKVKTDEQIEKFNRHEASVLIATSVAHVGVNIFPVHACFNWIGGTSEIKTKQAVVGRSVRKLSSSPYADKCQPKPIAKIFDFMVRDNELMKRHLSERIEYYKESGTSIKMLKIK